MMINFDDRIVAKFGLYPKKVLLSIWWDWKNIVYYELFSQSETINSAKYCNYFDKLKDAIAEKQPKMEATRPSRQCKTAFCIGCKRKTVTV